jgi:hypothetical protein
MLVASFEHPRRARSIRRGIPKRRAACPVAARRPTPPGANAPASGRRALFPWGTLALASLTIGPRHRGRGSAPRRQLAPAGAPPGGVGAIAEPSSQTILPLNAIQTKKAAGWTSRPSRSSTRMAVHAPPHQRWMAVTPFARLSLASTRRLVEEAVGRFAGYRKNDRGPAEGRSRTRGESSHGVAPSNVVDRGCTGGSS